VKSRGGLVALDWNFSSSIVVLLAIVALVVRAHRASVRRQSAFG
jgi:hypothetical protein